MSSSGSGSWYGGGSEAPATAGLRRLAWSRRRLREKALERPVGAAELVEPDRELRAVGEPEYERVAADVAEQSDRGALGQGVERRARAGHDEAAGAFAEQALGRVARGRVDEQRGADAPGQAAFGDRDEEAALGDVVTARERPGADGVAHGLDRTAYRRDVD